MAGYQKRITLKQIEGWPDQKEGTLIDRLNTLEYEYSDYEFIQEIEAEIWQVTHSLGIKHPAVQIFDVNGNTLIGNINYISNNYLEINFVIPTTGIAYIKK